MKILKKPIVLVICVLACVLISGGVAGYLVLYGGLPIIHTSKEQYGNWSKFPGYSGLCIFPKEISDSNIEKYYYQTQDTIFSPECQVFLEAKYTPEQYGKELGRLDEVSIKHKKEENKVEINNTDFSSTAYVSIFGWHHSYEYALLNKKENKIVYVFVQNIEKDKIKFSKDYLPNTYGQKVADDYTMYGFGTGKNEMVYKSDHS